LENELKRATLDKFRTGPVRPSSLTHPGNKNTQLVLKAVGLT